MFFSSGFIGLIKLESNFLNISKNLLLTRSTMGTAKATFRSVYLVVHGAYFTLRRRFHLGDTYVAVTQISR
jgi:hypothetical protein